MILISRLRRRYTGDQGAGALSAVVEDVLDHHKKENIWVALSKRFRHFGTRATFSYCVLMMAVLNAWQVVLWGAFTGAQLYWIAILYNEDLIRQFRR